MNPGYARTYTDFWTGATGLRLAMTGEEGARALAHFLFSGPNCDPFGLYRKPVEVIVHEFKHPARGEFLAAERDVRRWLGLLAELDYAEVDEANGFIWVKEMAAYQFRPLPWKPTNLLIKSARRWYANLARNRFLGPYFDRYDYELHLSNPFAFPGTEVARREWIPPPVQLPLVEPVSVKSLAVRVACCGEAEFNEWWQHYPSHRRKARAACLKVWQRKRVPVEKFPQMLELLIQQKQAADWTKDGGQFIPLPLTYLNQERYDDETPGMSHGGLNPTNQVTADTLSMLLSESDEP